MADDSLGPFNMAAEPIQVVCHAAGKVKGAASQLQDRARYYTDVVGIFDELAIPWQTFFVDFPLFGLGTVSLSPTPNPPVPFNPAIEEDQLKAFVTMKVGP